jgi:hypothetical protein
MHLQVPAGSFLSVLYYQADIKRTVSAYEQAEHKKGQLFLRG